MILIARLLLLRAAVATRGAVRDLTSSLRIESPSIVIANKDKARGTTNQSSLRVFCEAKDEAISLTILNREIASLLALLAPRNDEESPSLRAVTSSRLAIHLSNPSFVCHLSSALLIATPLLSQRLAMTAICGFCATRVTCLRIVIASLLRSKRRSNLYDDSK